MNTYNWNYWYAAWGWFLWFGLFFLFFSSIGNWGYTYSAHRKYGGGNLGKDALDILNERYARGDIKQEEYAQIKLNIFPEAGETCRASSKEKITKNQVQAFPSTLPSNS